MIWLRVSITGLFLIVIIYLQFFVDFNAVIESLTLEDEPAALQNGDQSQAARLKPAQG
ncbi:MAG: hypothetical protein ACOH5I_19945 [Oligoflexus sp.]